MGINSVGVHFICHPRSQYCDWHYCGKSVLFTLKTCTVDYICIRPVSVQECTLHKVVELFLLFIFIVILIKLYTVSLYTGISGCLLWAVYCSDGFSDNHLQAFQKKHPEPRTVPVLSVHTPTADREQSGNA